ncbi:hypothetical protein AAY473_031005, partial [Plecturocebus cupreus]
MGFHLVGQAAPELLTSGYLPVSASQSAGITGVSPNCHPNCSEVAQSMFTTALTPGFKILLLLPRLESNASGAISAHHNLHLLGSSDSLASASRVVGIIDMCHHTWLTFRWDFSMLVGLISNSRPQVICPPQSPKVLIL